MSFSDIILSSEVKGVLIDLDDTLYVYEPCHQEALSACYVPLFQSHYSYDEFKRTYREHRNRVMEQLAPSGTCRSRRLAFQSWCEDLGVESASQEAIQLDKLYWNKFMSVMTLDKEAELFLKKAKKKSLPICIVSDMLTEIQLKKIECLNINAYIDSIVTSEEVGVEKPHALMFQSALEKIGLSAADVIMIGDHPIKDIKGAQSMGINAYHIQR